MKRKGFTLIELIVCIVLIGLIGTSSIVIVNTSKKDDDRLKQKIEHAVEVYLSTEKDNDGLTYLNGIHSGGKGLYFTINDLYEKGYLDENVVKTLEKDTNKDKKELKLLASISLYEDNASECGTNYIKIDFSWDTPNNQEPLYLCPTNIKPTTPGDKWDDRIDEHLITYTNNGDTENIKGDLEYEQYIFSTTNDYIYSEIINSGLYKRTEDGKVIYYYRGDVDNNFIILEGDIENILYRIVEFTDDYIKIVSENSLPNVMYIENWLIDSYYNVVKNGYNYTLYYPSIEKWTNVMLEHKYNCADYSYHLDYIGVNNKIFKHYLPYQKKELETSMGLLTPEDLVYSGIYGGGPPFGLITESIGTTSSNLVVSSNSYLTTGGITMLCLYSTNANISSRTNAYLNNYSEYSHGAYGYGKRLKGAISYVNFYYNNYLFGANVSDSLTPTENAFKFRPVFVLDKSKIMLKTPYLSLYGEPGTKGNPFVIKMK